MSDPLTTYRLCLSNERIVAKDDTCAHVMGASVDDQ